MPQFVTLMVVVILVCLIALMFLARRARSRQHSTRTTASAHPDRAGAGATEEHRSGGNQ